MIKRFNLIPQKPPHSLRRRNWTSQLSVLLLLFGAGSYAQEGPATSEQALTAVAVEARIQEPAPASETPELMAIEALPNVTHLAAALSDRSSRVATLLTMITVSRLLDSASFGGVLDPDLLQAQFRDDRAWLDQLATRYTDLPVRGSQLDPAAWFVMQELSQHLETPGLAVSPLGPGNASLVRQLFDRGDELLAAAVLPEVLQRIETRSPALWISLVESASANDALLAAISGLYGDWFAPWLAVELPPVTVTEQDQVESDAVIEAAMGQLRTFASSVMLTGPVDESDLKNLRFDLLSVLPTLYAEDFRQAGYLLALATTVDGLQDKKYLALTETLLWIVSDLLLNEPEPNADVQADPDQQAAGPEVVAEPVNPSGPPIAKLLFELLPWLSSSFAAGFSEVDPRINTSLATVFDAVQYLQGTSRDPVRLASLRGNVGDAIAQLVLLIPDMSYYFDQPVRRRITEEINVCASIVANRDQPGPMALSREQFDGCMKSLVALSTSLVTREELSGDQDGPFGSEQVRRELMMAPWQRINFALGYLHDRFPIACELPGQPLPNPIEWSSLANMVTWLARQAPVYFQTPENEALVVGLRQQGLDMIREMSRQADCVSGVGMGINDPVRRSLASYRLALNELVAGIREAELEFRAANLLPGADVVFHGDASQQTAYRTDKLLVSPCDPARVCEMSGSLEATRALIGLFPDTYLIADQTGMGSIEICYQNVQWVNRRDVPVRPDDPNVANYYGQLSFDLVGKFREKKGNVTEVFGSNFTSPDEYHYLFAAATDEIRDDNCPTEWVGSRIVTTLNSQREYKIVPNRLTYLAAARKKPSQVLEANWSRGAEWRDWFVTGLGITPHEYPQDDAIAERVNKHLRKLYRAQQSMIYAALLKPQPREGGTEAVHTLVDLQEELTARKALIRTYLNLFYPRLMIDSDQIRGLLEGNESLLDSAILLRFRDSNVDVSEINETGLERLDQFKSFWHLQPEPVRRSGSVAVGVAHAIIRLNELYLEFFAPAPEKVEFRSERVNPAASPG